MTDSYLYIIVALLPLAGAMVVLQEDPYHALVVRGILGAIAAMTYAVLGAADVALTEALVGTMLAITLYAIAVRSSLVMRLGVLEQDTSLALTELTEALRPLLNPYHLRLEIVPYANGLSLERALADREVHGIWEGRSQTEVPYHLTLRVQRLYEILDGKLPPHLASLSYRPLSPGKSPSFPVPQDRSADLEEAQP